MKQNPSPLFHAKAALQHTQCFWPSHEIFRAQLPYTTHPPYLRYRAHSQTQTATPVARPPVNRSKALLKKPTVQSYCTSLRSTRRQRSPPVTSSIYPRLQRKTDNLRLKAWPHNPKPANNKNVRPPPLLFSPFILPSSYFPQTIHPNPTHQPLVLHLDQSHPTSIITHDTPNQVSTKLAYSWLI